MGRSSVADVSRAGTKALWSLLTNWPISSRLRALSMTNLMTSISNYTGSIVGSAGRLLRMFGPGLVTGAADDDPSGIATYSQAGAQFGYTMSWTMFLTTPFMIAIQMGTARIGAVTGNGLAA